MGLIDRIRCGLSFSEGDFMNSVILNKNKDFLAAYKRGRYMTCREIAVYYRKNGLRSNRFGVTTGKKVGNAVVRSRCRRIIRRAYYENERLFPKGYDIVIAARPGCGDAKSTALSAFIRNKVIRAITNN
jgi:ribonuclease P protein component